MSTLKKRKRSPSPSTSQKSRSIPEESRSIPEESRSISEESRSIPKELRPVIDFNSKVDPAQMTSEEKNFLYQQHFKEATNKSKRTKYEKNAENKRKNLSYGIFNHPISYRNMLVNQEHDKIINYRQTRYDDDTNYYDKHNGPIIFGSTPKKPRIIKKHTPYSTYYSPNENDRLVNESAHTHTPIIVGGRKKRTQKRKLRKTKRKRQNKRKSRKSRK